MSERTYGTPLSKDLVRALRERAGLSQEALAIRLGLAGKAVVSGWETGRTSCEGPAAELLLHLFASDTSRSYGELSEVADATWRRAGTWADTWRQIAAVPEASDAIERDAFASLFPGVEIPARQHVLGFPFVERPAAFGIGSTGWSGALPAERDRAPDYIWHLDRAGAFLYRETLWEEQRRESTTGGHTHVGSLLELAACAAVFLARLARAASLHGDARYALRVDLEGMQGRGIVADDTAPTMLSNERHLSASITCSLGSVMSSPLDTAYSLVGECLVLIRPDLAPLDRLAAQLDAWLARDRRRPTRCLGFIDELR
jgi:transcriptional regulator with XRE-family HTH domain